VKLLHELLHDPLSGFTWENLILHLDLYHKRLGTEEFNRVMTSIVQGSADENGRLKLAKQIQELYGVDIDCHPPDLLPAIKQLIKDMELVNTKLASQGRKLEELESKLKASEPQHFGLVSRQISQKMGAVLRSPKTQTGQFASSADSRDAGKPN
jgi:hypothetical protein